MLFPVALILSLIASVQSACDNQCSGHGSCLTDDVCSCYDNWGIGLAHDSGDCSDRICPYEIAWVDSPNRSGRFHKYAECAGRGLCDRQTGECQCFDGYEGKACQRSTCPNDCSGHGTCEYVEDLFYADTWNEYAKSGFFTDPKTFPYHNWDEHKSRACKCDATYGDVDCSKRMCPYGTDVLDVRNDLLASAKYHVQQIYFEAPEDAQNLGNTFALTFKSRLNETFTTIPIYFDYSDVNNLVHDIQLSLLSLPNRVIDGITVAGVEVSATAIYVNITFTGSAVQGPQHLVTVEDYECSAGCTPKLTGLFMETRYGYAKSNISEYQTSDFNSYECGRRGRCDYSTGLCQCFLGYTGDNCNTLTTLV